MLSKNDINNIVEKIKTNINPKQIYLFGSYAEGRETDLSDVDLLIVDDSGRNKNALALEISSMLFPRHYGLELIVASPEEIEEKKRKKLMFWENILNKGKKYYERS